MWLMIMHDMIEGVGISNEVYKNSFGKKLLLNLKLVPVLRMRSEMKF